VIRERTRDDMKELQNPLKEVWKLMQNSSDADLALLLKLGSDEYLTRERFSRFENTELRLGWVSEPGGIFHEWSSE